MPLPVLPPPPLPLPVPPGRGRGAAAGGPGVGAAGGRLGAPAATPAGADGVGGHAAGGAVLLVEEAGLGEEAVHLPGEVLLALQAPCPVLEAGEAPGETVPGVPEEVGLGLEGLGVVGGGVHRGDAGGVVGGREAGEVGGGGPAPGLEAGHGGLGGVPVVAPRVGEAGPGPVEGGVVGGEERLVGGPEPRREARRLRGEGVDLRREGLGGLEAPVELGVGEQGRRGVVVGLEPGDLGGEGVEARLEPGPLALDPGPLAGEAGRPRPACGEVGGALGPGRGGGEDDGGEDDGEDDAHGSGGWICNGGATPLYRASARNARDPARGGGPGSLRFPRIPWRSQARAGRRASGAHPSRPGPRSPMPYLSSL